MVLAAIRLQRSTLQGKYRNVFRDRSENASVIVVSCNEQTILQLCDLLAILRDGKMNFSDNLNQALKEEYRRQQYELDT